MSSEIEEIAAEQRYVDMLYARLDHLLAQASGEHTRTSQAGEGTRQHLVERDVQTRELAGRLAGLDAAEDGLCFGRLDLESGERRYVGRIGILDEDSDYEPVLIDWRAPAAGPFYTATSAAPLGVRRRRHVHTRMRTVVGIDDDALGTGVLDSSAAPDQEIALVGEAALLSALATARTGRMRDVVETIQSEQDAVIRDKLQGILVVQGGPGTGKTAVALHRAAYLLYTHRDRLVRRGVLIVGPNTTFLRYISHVLPSLGETSAALLTVGELFPGVEARAAEEPQAAEIKGRAQLAQVLDSAITALRKLPEEDEPLRVVVDGVSYLLDRETCLDARDKALATREPHNLARPVFVERLLDVLADQAVERLTQDPFEELTADLLEAIAKDLETHGLVLDGVEDQDGGGYGPQSLVAAVDRDQVRRGLSLEPAVHAALTWLWPELTPQRLLAELYSSPVLLDQAAPQFTQDERTALRREPGADWTVADVPLLDEAAELLGALDPQAAARELKRREEIAYAQGVLDILAGSRSTDLEDPREEIVSAADLLNAEALADLQAVRDLRTVAQRAMADRTWTFGHVIVDEAQELSAMAWRLLLRRCPARSMTLVGDIAQTGDLAGAASWRSMLEPFAGDRWRTAELTVNYRTPKEIMALAAEVLARIDRDWRPPRSVRESGVAPRRETVAADRLGPRLAQLAQELDAAVGEGRLAVIVPENQAAPLAAAVAQAVPGAATGAEPDLERRTVVLTARQAKGLEFDNVLLVEPEAIAAAGPRGLNDLYVALTRATKDLVILETRAQ
jgi:DNA helicase IV